MEDWAYAGNWDPDSQRVPCIPNTFGGYPQGKTQYTDDMLRTVNILVETSNAKWPSSFGTPENILNAKSGTGHVPRNARLALMLTDIVEPYIVITSASITKDGKVEVKWEVGGSFDVDATWLEVTTTEDNGQSTLKKGQMLSGKTRWATATYQDRTKYPFKPRFTTCFPTPAQHKSKFSILVKATVDSAWSMTGKEDSVSPRGYSPQTHVVNARTNPSWQKSNAGFTIKGRQEWSSKRIVFDIPPPKSTKDDQEPPQGRRLDADNDHEHLIYRIMDTAEGMDDDIIAPSKCELSLDVQILTNPQTDDGNDPDGTPGSSFSFPVSSIFTIVAFVGFIGVLVYMYKTRRTATHQKLATVDGEEA